MPNAAPEIVLLQKKVFDSLDEPLEQIQDSCSHGEFLTQTLRENAHNLDVVVFFDLDCIPLKTGVVQRAIRAAMDHEMIIGCAYQANHIEEQKMFDKRRNWPIVLRKLDSLRICFCKLAGIDPFHFKNPLIIAGPCFLVVPTEIYRFVGSPTLVVTSRADAAGELTIACRERGVKVICLQPTYCHVPKYKLGNQRRLGLGTIFGRCIFHAFETTYLHNSQSASLFQRYCKDVISGTQQRPSR